MRKVKIIGTGTALPKTKITDVDLESKMALEPGWISKKTGVLERYHVRSETALDLAAEAIQQCFLSTGMTLSDIDAIVCTSGTQQQSIPCMAALIQSKIGGGKSGVPCFDINATCLSFLMGLDLVSYMQSAGKYKNVLFVSTEASSTAINWSEKESATLIGDGAVAVIVGKTPDFEQSQILDSQFATYGAGANFVEFLGGGTKMMADLAANPTLRANQPPFQFKMDGEKVFRMTADLFPSFLDKLLSPHKLTINDFAMVIPHQASMMALSLMCRRLKIPRNKFFINVEKYGNMVSASIPMALHECIQQQLIRRGERIICLGTAAGVTFGGMIIDY